MIGKRVVRGVGMEHSIGRVYSLFEHADSFAFRAGEERLKMSANGAVVNGIDLKDHRIRAFCLSLARETISLVTRLRLVLSDLSIRASLARRLVLIFSIMEG